GSPTRGRYTTSPAATGVLVRTAPSSVDRSPDSARTVAPGYGEDGANESCTATSAAFNSPRSGSSSYTSRKVTPAARNEIAMGMNRVRRNALTSRTRSVSTANMSPNAVTTVGATITQIALLVIARRVFGEVNIST